MDSLDLSRAAWRKSTYSSAEGECVEVARHRPDVIAIRDSKDPGGPELAFTPAQWKAFTSTVKAKSS